MEWLTREVRFLLARLVTNFFAVLAITQLLDGVIVRPESLWVASLSLAAVLAGINSYVRPGVQFILKPVGCLLSLLTFGFSHFLISALVFWIATLIVDDFVVSGVGPALLGTLIISLVGAFGSLVFGKRRNEHK